MTQIPFFVTLFDLRFQAKKRSPRPWWHKSFQGHTFLSSLSSTFPFEIFSMATSNILQKKILVYTTTSFCIKKEKVYSYEKGQLLQKYGGRPTLMAINNTCQKPSLVPKGPLALMPKCNDDHFCFFSYLVERTKVMSALQAQGHLSAKVSSGL